MSLRVASHVTVVDLSVGLDGLAESGFSELQRGELPVVREGVVDSSRVLVVGSEDDVRHSHELMEEILVAPSVQRTLCVVFSRARGARAASGPVELPLAFEGAKVGVIWVGDPRGVLWKPGSAKARALTVSRSDPDGESVLAALTDALRAPGVFDAAFAATSRPSTASSPGLRLLVPDAAMSLLGRGEIAAVEEMTGASKSQLAARIDVPFYERESDLRFLQGEAPRPPEDHLFESDGAIGLRVAAVKTAVTIAREAGGALLAHPLQGQTSDVLDSVRGVGESLGELKRYLTRELLEVIDGSDGLDPGELDVLRLAGLRGAAIRPAQELSADESENRLRELVGAELQRCQSLLDVARELRAWSAKTTPRSSARTVADLDVACPDELIDELGEFSPLRLQLGGARPTIALVVASAAVTCRPAPWFAIGLALLTIALLTSLARWGALTRGRSPTRLDGKAKAIGVAVFGGAAGFLVDAVVGGQALAACAAVVAPIAFLTWLWSIWRASVERWTGHARLEEATRAVDAVIETTASVAMNDWVLANPRLRHARTAARLADILEEISAALLGGLAPASDATPDVHATHWSDTCNPAIRVDLNEAAESTLLRYASAVRAIIAHDYANLIMQAVDDGWADVVTGADDQGQDVVSHAFAARLGHYRRDLRDHGLFRSSSRRTGDGWTDVDDPGSPRGKLLSRIWSETEGLDELLSVPIESELVQLCAPQHLLLLDEDPAEAHMLRFAPDSYRANGSTTIQTSSMLMAGVMRLVRLRAGTLRFGD